MAFPPRSFPSLNQSCLAAFFVVAGALHFIKPDFYIKIVPRGLPHPALLVFISGVFEILGGLGLLQPGLRNPAGWGLIFLLVAVFPANLQMASDAVHQEPVSLRAALTLLRLPLQVLFIVWVRTAMAGSGEGMK